MDEPDKFENLEKLNEENTNLNEEILNIKNGKKSEINKKIKFKRKSCEPGVMYLSTLPPTMTPLHLRQIFEKYGEVGRIFLQPDEQKKRKGKQKFTYNSGTYSEGWVEMADKKLAKRLALTINSTPISDGKKKKFSEHMWNIKYLHRFRWTHLTERLAYEKAVFQQKMRTESAQARRETDAFIANVEASKKFASIKERKEKMGIKVTEKRKITEFKQRKTVEELQAEKAKRQKNENPAEKRANVLLQIFSKS